MSKAFEVCLKICLKNMERSDGKKDLADQVYKQSSTGA